MPLLQGKQQPQESVLRRGNKLINPGEENVNEMIPQQKFTGSTSRITCGVHWERSDRQQDKNKGINRPPKEFAMASTLGNKCTKRKAQRQYTQKDQPPRYFIQDLEKLLWGKVTVGATKTDFVLKEFPDTESVWNKCGQEDGNTNIQGVGLYTMKKQQLPGKIVPVPYFMNIEGRSICLDFYKS